MTRARRSAVTPSSRAPCEPEWMNIVELIGKLKAAGCDGRVFDALNVRDARSYMSNMGGNIDATQLFGGGQYDLGIDLLVHLNVTESGDISHE